MGDGIYACRSSGDAGTLPDGCVGSYRADQVGITFSDDTGAPQVHIVKGLREVFVVSCWRDTRGQVFYLGFVADVHIERLGLPAQPAAQTRWAIECLDAVGRHEANGWRQVRADGRTAFLRESTG